MQSGENTHKLLALVCIGSAHTSSHEAIRPDQEHTMIWQVGHLLPALLACGKLPFRSDAIGRQFDAKASGAFSRSPVPVCTIWTHQQDEMTTRVVKGRDASALILHP